MRLLVRAVGQLTADIRSFELVDPDGAELPSFEAGAHLQITVGLPSGGTGTRSYSLVNTPGDRTHYEIAVLHQRDGRGGSAWMHGSVTAGDLLEVGGPANAFALQADADRHVLLAGGIGITPLLCMARVLSARRAAVELHYFGRRREAMAYRTALAQLPGISLHEWVGLDAAASAATMARCLAAPGPGTHMYVCGPPAMLQAALDVAARQGWPAAQLHHERFGPAEGSPAGEPFTVELRQSGLRFDVGSGQSLLDALIAQGVDAAYDCRAGICGSCLVPVAQGQVVHRDSFLSAEDKASGELMCACVSRARGHLLLDL